MPRAVDLLRQKRYEEIWQMCCGYLKLDLAQFMEVQKRLLLGQIELLNHSGLGKKIIGENFPTTVQEFRKSVPLTEYGAYCPELFEKQESLLPEKPAQWVHTSGRTGEFPCKWIPISQSCVREMAPILYGIGLLSASSHWGDLTPFMECPNFIYTVAPRPYMSGALASMLQEQTPHRYYPSLPEAENLPFEERIKLGFEEALSGGLDYFFGLSLVLSAVGTKFSQSTSSINIRPYLSDPKALLRLTGGLLKSRLARRKLLPKDLWHVKGIVTSGLDSSVYREQIKEFWGRYPLDIYSCTEGGIIATQTWDYRGMSFIPNLNFFEFISEKEHMKWKLDRKYHPETILLDEVKAGECYEIVITSLHGGSLVRYRLGDMIRITSLRNEALGVDIPQMAFERRTDDLLDFAAIRLNEKNIWQAIERTGVPYVDWVAYKQPGELLLNLLIEVKSGNSLSNSEIEAEIYKQIMNEELEAFSGSRIRIDANDMAAFKIKVSLLAQGTFSQYASQRLSEGADLAHLKPPHINPSRKVLESLLETTPAPDEIIRNISVKQENVPVS
jgi:hypothetical protein